MVTVKRGAKLCALAASVLLIATACGSSGGNGNGSKSPGNNGTTGGASSSTAGTPQRGGSVTDLLDAGFSGSWPQGLDPGTSAAAAYSQYMAIFGGLFMLQADPDGSNAKVAGYQAASGTISPDATTLTIKLKPGIKFSDGTPLDAQAVIWNWERDDKSTCTCKPQWQLRKKDPFTSPDPLTAVIHLAQPSAALLHNFPVSNVNWIVSPTAFKKMGEKAFTVKPVGAGPFTVVSDRLSTKLVLKRNPNFFIKGQPYLDNLTFQSITGDQPAYQALLAGQAQAFEGMSTPPVIAQAQKSDKLTVTLQPGTSPYLVHFNTNIAPFNNIKAREAMYYATDWNAISKGLFGSAPGGAPIVVQGFTTPADLYYHQKTPGYRTYDLAKAKALVKELGGIKVQLITTDVYTANEVVKALQTQWQKAGMTVTVKALQLNPLIKALTGGKWQAELGTAGAWDPGAGVGIGFRFSSTSPFTGVKDKKLDSLINQAAATAVDAQRDTGYQAVAKYISDKAYGMFGFAFANANVVTKGLQGPGLTTQVPALAVDSPVNWAAAWMSK
jgi:peptide/nickel transport system substrate-binding protein